MHSEMQSITFCILSIRLMKLLSNMTRELSKIVSGTPSKGLLTLLSNMIRELMSIGLMRPKVKGSQDNYRIMPSMLQLGLLRLLSNMTRDLSKYASTWQLIEIEICWQDVSGHYEWIYISN